MIAGGRAATGADAREERRPPDPGDDYTGHGGPGLELTRGGERPPEPERARPELTREELRRVHQEDAVPRLDSDAPGECGRAVVPTELVTVRQDRETGQLYLWGLRRCGNSTSCPTCSKRIAREREQELKEALERHLARGGGVVMLTLTTPHHAGLPGELAYQVLAEGWAKLKASATWKQIADEIGYVGTVTAHDCTHGPHGWHHHKHALILTEAPLDESKVEEMQERLGERWADRIERAYRKADGELGWRRIDRRIPTGHEPLVGRPKAGRGMVIQQADRDAAGYVAHTGLTREVTRVDGKKGRQGHRTPLQILRDYAADGEPRDLELWIEYARTMARKPALVWSPGLKDRLTVDEQTDLELAQDTERQEEDPELVTLTRGLWKALWRYSGADPGAGILRQLREGTTLEELQSWAQQQLKGDGKRHQVSLDPDRRELALLTWDPMVEYWNRS